MIHPFFICIFLFPQLSLASFDYTFKVEKAHKAFLKLKIDEGKDLITQAIQEDPNNGLAHLVANYGDVLTLLISENATLYEQLKDNETKRLKIISSLSSRSPCYLFSQAEIKLQWAVVKLKFGDELSSVWSIRQAFKMLEEIVRNTLRLSPIKNPTDCYKLPLVLYLTPMPVLPVWRV